MQNSLRNLYYRMQFHPGPLSMFCNPFYLARKALLNHLVPLAPRLKGRLLDVGCGRKPYQALFTSLSDYVGMEIDTPATRAGGSADFFYTGHAFPFPAESFDSVFCSQVLEHVFNPDEFLEEIRRILKPGGQFLLTVPFVWDEHEQPFDYARYSSFGLKHLLLRCGFRVVLQQKTLPDIRVLFQLVNAYIYKKTSLGNRLSKLLATFFLMSPFNIAGAMAHWILPGSNDLYLDNIVLAVKPAPSVQGVKQ